MKPMNPTREEALLALALEKPIEKRAAFVDAICDGDPALRQRLEASLAAYAQRATRLSVDFVAVKTFLLPTLLCMANLFVPRFGPSAAPTKTSPPAPLSMRGGV